MTDTYLIAGKKVFVLDVLSSSVPILGSFGQHGL